MILLQKNSIPVIPKFGMPGFHTYFGMTFIFQFLQCTDGEIVVNILRPVAGKIAPSKRVIVRLWSIPLPLAGQIIPP